MYTHMYKTLASLVLLTSLFVAVLVDQLSSFLRLGNHGTSNSILVTLTGRIAEFRLGEQLDGGSRIGGVELLDLGTEALGQIKDATVGCLAIGSRRCCNTIGQGIPMLELHLCRSSQGLAVNPVE